MAHKLKNLKIVKVDFVVEGANPDANIALRKQKDGEAAPEPLDKSGSATFTEELQEEQRQRRLDKITDDMWNLCYALNNSLCSILWDEDMDGEGKASAMRESVGEFTAHVDGAISNWTAGQPMGFVLKSSDEGTPDKIAETLAKGLEAVFRRVTPATGKSENDEPKGEEPKMRIDKTKLTPDELAALDAIEKKAGIPDEPPADGATASVPATVQEPQPAAKSVPAANPAPVPAPAADGVGDDIYKGLDPAVRKELEVLKKFRQDTEDKELMEIAKGYGILGNNPDELFSVLKNLKAKDQSAYDQMIATLNDAKTAVEKSGAFSEIGKTGNGSVTRGGAVKEAEGKAMELMKSRTDLSFAQAVDAILLADPELAKRYETEDE